MASRAITDLDPTLQGLAQEFLDQCKLIKLRAILIETYRGTDEQNADYEQGRNLPGPIITNAKGGQSPHNCCLFDGKPAARAFDFALYNPDGRSLDWNAHDAAWQTAIQIGKSLGLVSGSTFPKGLVDSDHFELPNWKAGAVFTKQSEDV